MKVQAIILLLIASGIQYGEGQYNGRNGWQRQRHHGGYRNAQYREPIAIIEQSQQSTGGVLDGLLNLPGQILQNLGLIPGNGGGVQEVVAGIPNGQGGGYQNGGFQGNGHAMACRTVMKTVFTNECQVKYEQVCETAANLIQPQEQPQTECHTVPETNCVPVSRTVPDKQCTTTTERQCVAEDQTIHETKYEEVCRNVEHRSCDQPGSSGIAPRTNSFTQSGIAPRTNAYNQGQQLPRPHRVYKREAHGGGYGGGTSQTTSNCQTTIQRICDSVPKQVARVIQVPRCQDVPKSQCFDTVKTVQDTECTETTREECIEIPAAPSPRAPAANCRQVPWKMCQKVPRQIPKQVCNRQPRQGYAHQPEYIAIVEF